MMKIEEGAKIDNWIRNNWLKIRKMLWNENQVGPMKRAAACMRCAVYQ